MKIYHNFKEAFSASKLLPAVAGEARGIDRDIIAIIFAGMEEFHVDFVVLGEALVDGRDKIFLERVFFDIFAYLFYLLDNLLYLVREGGGQNALDLEGV